MLAALVIAFREGLEASLIVGIVMGYLKKTDQTHKMKFAWLGVLAAVIVSVVLALILQAIGAELEGAAEQIFEGVTMFAAVAVLTWMIFWMRSQARTMKSEIEAELEAVTKNGQERGLFGVTFFAVVREGLETALFLSAAAFATNSSETLIGALIGLAIAAVVGYVIYASTMRLNLRMFFNVTSLLLLFFAAGLFAHGVHEFQEASVLPIIQEHVWDINHIVDENSFVGSILKAVLGYNGNPSLLEVLAYIVYWLVVPFGVQWFVERNAAKSATLVQAPKMASQA
ncbi:MAG: FTR1 family protein [Anaerolineaceae bacterium]|nr:FTR1 family protein [Anaerolineaceae bacterium]